MVRNQFLIILVFFIGVSIGGCAGVKPVELEPGTGYIYGSILIDGQSLPDKITLYEYGKVYATPFVNPPTAHIYTNGVFFFENLKPGKYYLASFYAGNELYRLQTSGSKTELEKHLYEIKPGSLVYVGAYNAKVKNRPLFGSGEFGFERVSTPDEKAVLVDLIKFMEDTGWDKIIKKRLSMLKK